MIQYINSINVNCNNKIFDDYNIFKVDRPSGNKESILYNLESVKEHIFAIFHERNNCSYLLTKKDFFDEKLLKKFLINFDVNQIFTVDDNVLLNLVLLLHSSRFDVKDVIVNSHYLKIVKSKNNQIVCLAFRFNNYILNCEVKTFSKFSDFKKYKGVIKAKSIYNFYKPGGNTLKEIIKPSEIEKEDLFVCKSLSNQTKNIIKSLKFSSSEIDFESCKLGCISSIYHNIFRNSKYFDEFSFKTLDLNEYKNEREYEFINKNISDFFKINTLNVVYPDVLEISKTCLKDFNVILSKKLINGFNLVVLDSSKKDEDLLSDWNYIKDKQSEFVIQHIGLDNLNNKNAVEHCLSELIIKNDLKNKKVSVLEMSKYFKDKTYKFYLNTEIEKVDEFGIEFKSLLYSMIEIDSFGNIIDLKVLEEDEFDENCNDVSINEYLIVDNLDNRLFIKNSKQFIIPDLEKIKKEIEQIEEGLNKEFIGSMLYDIFEEILLENPKKESEINDFLKTFPNINSTSSEIVKITDLGKIPKGIKKLLNDKLFYYYGNIRIISNLKGVSSGIVDSLYPAIINIHYNENKYMVSPFYHQAGKEYENNILIKEYEYEGDNILEELLPLMYVPFVRHKQLTVIPFPFKYLKEAIEIKKLR